MKKSSKTPSLSHKIQSPPTYITLAKAGAIPNKGNRSNSSLTVTSPSQLKLKPKSLATTSNISVNLSKNYFLLPNLPGNNRSLKSNNIKSCTNDTPINDSNKENASKCFSPNIIPTTGKYSEHSSKSFKKLKVHDSNCDTIEDDVNESRTTQAVKVKTPEHSNSGRLKLSEKSPFNVLTSNSHMKINSTPPDRQKSSTRISKTKSKVEVKESEEDFVELREKEENEMMKIDIFCTNHQKKRAKYFLIDECENPQYHQIVFICSDCTIECLSNQSRQVFNVQKELKDALQNNQNLLLPNEYKARFGYQTRNSNENNETIIEKNSENDECTLEESERRENEIKEFLKNLINTKNDNINALEALGSRKKDVIFFYDKQIIKLDQIHNFLMKIIERERNLSTAKLKQFMTHTTSSFNQKIQHIENTLKEIDFIQCDIEQNAENIVKHMENDPFQLILTKYKEKITQSQKYIDGLYQEKLALEKMTNSSIKIYQKKIEDLLTPQIISMFSTFEVNSSFLKKDVAVESESPIPNEKFLPKYNVFGNHNSHPNENNSIYISFENKEIFETALKNSHTGQDSKIEPKNINTFLDNKENNLKTPKSLDKNIREFNSAQPGKLLCNLNNEKTKSNGKNTKYLNLLDKINENQSNTKNFLIENCGFVSPPINKQKTEEKIGVFQSLDPRKTIQTTQKEIKNYEGFFNFIENKLQDNNSGNVTYQKTLFCSSPHFKDV